MNRSSTSIGYRRLRALVLGAAIAASFAAIPIATAAAADDAWGYEKVTPAGKGGGVVSSLDTFMSSLDGSSLLYSTMGSFDSYPSESIPLYTRYLGSRTPDGWETRGEDVRDILGNNTVNAGEARYNVQTVVGASNDLAYVMVASSAALTPGATERGGNLYLRNTKTKALTLIATSPEANLSDAFLNVGGQRAASVASDGRAVLFNAPEPLLPGAPASALYSWRAGQGLRVESVLPADEGGAVVAGGWGFTGEEGTHDAILYDDALSRVYFSESGNGGGVYVRAGGETKLISRSRIPGDPSTPVRGRIDAIQGQGRYVIFDVMVPLTESTPTTGETAGAQHIYRYDAVDESLTYIGSISNPSFASNDILQVSPDGQTVAFQSTLQLLPGANSGSTNLYVRHGGTLRLALATDPNSPGGAGSSLRHLSPNGRYLAFTDHSTTLSERFGAPNISRNCPRPFAGAAGPCMQVYVYDAVADKLSCASCRRDGQAPLGDAGDPPVNSDGLSSYVPGTMRFMSHLRRLVSNDGSVLFTSLDGLVAADVNGANDVYRWRDGQVQMLSRGLAGTSSRFLDASEDGKTMFFSTNDAIVPIDTDRSVDIYMTRPGAGFTYKTVDPATPCSGGDCRDATSPPAPLALPGSGGLLGAFDARDGGRASGAGRPRVASKATVTGSSGVVKVTVLGPGRLSVSGKGLRSSALTVTEAGSYHLTVRLTTTAARTLSRKKRVSVGATARFVPRAGKPGAAKVALTFKSKSARTKGR